jgi:N-acetylglucosaminyldiphosphoundecaprenol N-acetyl-beta-D-mannosaminyltransferase
LQTAVRGQFGATINMQAGTVKRAPKWIQNVGAEWLWRVKEEPYLWRRYMQDGLGLLKIVAVSVLPLALLRLHSKTPGDLTVDVQELPTTSVVNLSGQTNVRNVDLLIRATENLMPFEKDVRLDLSRLTYVDARFFGLILVLRKILARAGRRLFISGLTRRMTLLFKLNGFAFLISNEE